MKRQKLEIGHPLECVVYWYDQVPEPPRGTEYAGQVGRAQVGLRDRIPGNGQVTAK